MSKYSRRPSHFKGHASLGAPRKLAVHDARKLEKSEFDISTEQGLAAAERHNPGMKVNDARLKERLAAGEITRERYDELHKQLFTPVGSHHSLRRVTAEPFHKKDTSLRLNIRTAVIVPSTHHGNKPVDKAAYERRVKETERFLAKTYGGYTAVSAHGGYVGERGKLIDEPVTEVVAYTDKKGYAKNRGKVERFLAKKQGQWTQESIGYERDVNAHLYYYKKK